jgi:hypothetical protein
MIKLGTSQNLSDSFYVGRILHLGDSELGNPFAVAGCRDTAVKAYRVYFANVMNGLKIVDSIAKAKEKYPGCVVSTSWRFACADKFRSEVDYYVEHYQKTGELQLACHCYNPAIEFNRYEYRCHTEVVASYVKYKTQEN